MRRQPAAECEQVATLLGKRGDAVRGRDRAAHLHGHVAELELAQLVRTRYPNGVLARQRDGVAGALRDQAAGEAGVEVLCVVTPQPVRRGLVRHADRSRELPRSAADAAGVAGVGRAVVPHERALAARVRDEAELCRLPRAVVDGEFHRHQNNSIRDFDFTENVPVEVIAACLYWNFPAVLPTMRMPDAWITPGVEAPNAFAKIVPLEG